MRVRLSILWIVCLILNSVAFSAEESPVRLEKVSIHLFLENSGTLSDDVTSIFGFSAWNYRPTGMVFSADDTFQSFLIKVWFSSEQETFQASEQAHVLIKSEKTGKVLFQSPIKGVYVAKDGKTVKPFLVSGHVCEPLLVEVRGRPKSITKTLPFKCGE